MKKEDDEANPTNERRGWLDKLLLLLSCEDSEHQSSCSTLDGLASGRLPLSDETWLESEELDLPQAGANPQSSSMQVSPRSRGQRKRLKLARILKLQQSKFDHSILTYVI